MGALLLLLPLATVRRKALLGAAAAPAAPAAPLEGAALAVEVEEGGGVEEALRPLKVLSSVSAVHVAAPLRGLHRMTLQQGCVLQGTCTSDTLLAVESTRKSE